MKRFAKLSPPSRPTMWAKTPPRRGSTIVVVIALLLALTFLGLVGYSIGTQEFSNATYFSDSAGDTSASDGGSFGISSDSLFDWSLRQIILGTYQDSERQSALHGGHLSLLPTMYGINAVPYDGEGTHLAWAAGNNIIVDQNYDGAADATSAALLELNRAPYSGGPGAAITNQAQGTGYPAPDVGYNYWDINSPYLAYNSTQHVINSTGLTTTMRIPSFHRPQYLRATGVPANQWYSSNQTTRRVLRPHQEHRAVDTNGVVTNTRRFISNAYPDNRTGVPASDLLSSFPFMANTADTTTPTKDDVNDGIWDPNPLGVGNSFTNAGRVSYDADPDNDGYKEAIWMDLGYPVQIRENPDGTVTKFVPMFAVTIYDADALFNLNAHGNLAGISSFQNTFGQFGPTGAGSDGTYYTADDQVDLRFASQSNQGVSPSEVNPQWGMLAPTSEGSTTQHQRFFNHAPANQIELSNMEWWFLLKGRADLDASSNIDKLYPGLYGESTQLNTAMSNSLPLFSYPKPGSSFNNYPRPGLFNIPLNLQTDDNQNALLGGRYQRGWQLRLPRHFVLPQQHAVPRLGATLGFVRQRTLHQASAG